MTNPYSTYQEPQPKRKRVVWPWILLAGALMVACLFGVAATVGSMLDQTGPPKPGQTRLLIPSPTSGQTSQAKTGKVTLVAKDVKLTLKVTKKDCYGEAGCSIEYKITAAADLDKLKASGNEYFVTYEVKGLQDPQTATLTLHSDGTYDQDGYQAGWASSAKSKMSVTVTDVEVR